MFVLLHRIAHEGDTLLGVYSTRERAEDAYEVWCEDLSSVDADEMAIVPVGVDSPAEMHW